MSIDEELLKHSPARDSVLTIGVFDGVHRGHGHLMAHLSAQATRSGLLSGVVTFRNHPASVLSPDFRAAYLTTVDERLHLITQLGVDFVVPLTFDLELSRVTARRFVDLLKRHLRMTAMVAGPDFALGRNREGDISTLAALGDQMGFLVHVVEPLVDEHGRVIGSTTVRDALTQGDVTLVAELQGRNFVLEGTVVKGLGRGAPMGFPTANLKLQEGIAVPGDGIYATWAHIEGKRHMAATSIGIRPTFDEAGHSVEAFILDFQGDLYGRDVRLEFVRRLRDEAKFESAEALHDQVGRDVDRTREILQSS